MSQLGPFLALIAVAAVVLAGLGGAMAWYNEEGRRIRRGLRKVLKGDTHALIIAYGRGRGAGFNFTSNTMAVAWDAANLDLPAELAGCQVVACTFRDNGEATQPRPPWRCRWTDNRYEGEERR